MAVVVPLRPAGESGADGAPYDEALPEAPPHDTGGGPPGGGAGQDAQDPPRFGKVVPLGTALKSGAAAFVLLDAGGQRVTHAARDMHTRAILSALFGASAARSFLAERWPHLVPKRDQSGKFVRDEDGRMIMVPSGGFSAPDLGDDLMAACIRLGPADALDHRRDGVWPGEDDGLAVHLGNAIIAMPQNRRHAPGWRLGTALHVSARPRTPPDRETSATAAECAALEARFRTWSYAPAVEQSAPALLMGMVAVGIYSGALAWRPHAWLRGPSNAGKSTLMDFIVAACGADQRSKDVSEAFVRNAFDGRASLIALDEEEPNLAGVAAVLNLMRGASDGEGARTGRVIDGAGHLFRVACPFLMAAISTPAFEPADASRITTISLRRPDQNRQAEARDAIARAKLLHPALFARLLDGWGRFNENLAVYRGALMGRSATSRCADQIATLLAGRRVLIDDAPIDPLAAAEDINVLEVQVLTPDAAAEFDAPTQVLAHLLASRVPIGDGRQSGTIAQLVEQLRDAIAAYQKAMAETPTDPSVTPIKADMDKQVGNAGALQLRWASRERGLIVGATSPMINRCFDGTPWANRVWMQALRDVAGATDAGSVKFRRAPQARAVWIPEVALGLMPPAHAPHPGPWDDPG